MPEPDPQRVAAQFEAPAATIPVERFFDTARSQSGHGYRLDLPAGELGPVLVGSPRSGRMWPDHGNVSAEPDILRLAGDPPVDTVVGAGVPHVRAVRPAWWVDLTQPPGAAYDPALLPAAWRNEESFAQAWPYPISATMPSDAGQGLFARVARTESGEAVEIYGSAVTEADLLSRLHDDYLGYHAAQDTLLKEMRAAYGTSVYVEMRTVAGDEATHPAGTLAPDFVISDGAGRFADPRFAQEAADFLRGRGYQVSHASSPLSSVSLLRHGVPEEGRHALQIGINRDSFWNTHAWARAGSDRLTPDLEALFRQLRQHAQARPGTQIEPMPAAAARPEPHEATRSIFMPVPALPASLDYWIPPLGVNASNRQRAGLISWIQTILGPLFDTEIRAAIARLNPMLPLREQWTQLWPMIEGRLFRLSPTEQAHPFFADIQQLDYLGQGASQITYSYGGANRRLVAKLDRDELEYSIQSRLAGQQPRVGGGKYEDKLAEIREKISINLAFEGAVYREFAQHFGSHVLPEHAMLKDVPVPGRIVMGVMGQHAERIDPNGMYFVPATVRVQPNRSDLYTGDRTHRYGIGSNDVSPLERGAPYNGEPIPRFYMEGNRAFLIDPVRAFDEELFLAMQPSPDLARLIQASKRDPALKAQVADLARLQAGYMNKFQRLVDELGEGNVILTPDMWIFTDTFVSQAYPDGVLLKWALDEIAMGRSLGLTAFARRARHRAMLSINADRVTNGLLQFTDQAELAVRLEGEPLPTTDRYWANVFTGLTGWSVKKTTPDVPKWWSSQLALGHGTGGIGEPPNFWSMDSDVARLARTLSGR